jgi:hypothetical protein
MTSDTRLPKPELRGVGHIRYRCADCGQLMEPEDAVIVQGQSYHVHHQPEETDHGR